MIALAAHLAGVALGFNANSPVEAAAGVESSYEDRFSDPAVGGTVIVTPDQAFNGEEITITLQGFGSNTRLFAGSASLGEVRLPIPGYFDFPGSEPVSNSNGWVTFRSKVPREVPAGPQTLTVDWGTGEQVTAAFLVLSAPLTVSPSTAVANQTVVLRGSGFTPSPVPGGQDPTRVHQISGAGDSYVSLAGLRLGPAYVPYPINLDSDGTLYTTMTLPLVDATVTFGELEVVVTDTTGRTGTVKLDIQQRSLTISPLLSPPGSTVTLTGQGFIASNGPRTGTFPVNISYDGTRQSTVVPDGSGNFVTQMTIPVKNSGGFPKTITASISGFPGQATASHDVPGRRLHLDPSAGPPGTIITITGISFPGYAQLSSLNFDKRPVMPAPVPSTDGGGGFTTSITVPELDVGYYIVGAVVRGVQLFARYLVTEHKVAENPLPTPQAAPVALAASVQLADSNAGTPSASALAPLEGNLVRVWSLDQPTERWSYYDPVGYLGSISSLKEMTPGQLYLIRVVNQQTATLNYRERHLYAGWNRVHW